MRQMPKEVENIEVPRHFWEEKLQCSAKDLEVNSIFLRPESGPEPGPSHVRSFETCLDLEYPGTKCDPELGPVLCPVSHPKFKMSIELTPSPLLVLPAIVAA